MLTPMDYYSERLKRFGDDVRALGWGSIESQRVRFKVLSEIAVLGGDSILDFGCGLGDLYDYLGRPAWYTGYDCHPAMLERARARYPSARFVGKPEPADYVLASGVLNLDRCWSDTLKEMWDLCRKGLACNFTSALAPRQNREILYFDPFDDGVIVARLTTRFTIRHDYKSNDFTIYAYR